MREDLRDRSPLGPRAERAIAERERTIEALRERMGELLLAFVCAPDAKRVRSLAKAAYTSLDPETIEWAHTSRMLADTACAGICKQCDSEVHQGHLGRPWETPNCPTVYQHLCPGEFGAVRYADVCAA